jgi:hypothetical protein
LNPPSRSGNEVNAQLFLFGTDFRKMAEKEAPGTESTIKMSKNFVHIPVFCHNAHAT